MYYVSEQSRDIKSLIMKDGLRLNYGQITDLLNKGDTDVRWLLQNLCKALGVQE